MRIVFVASEVYPFASTGGLSDVTGSLPKALRDSGHDVCIIMPLYRNIKISRNTGWVAGDFSTSAGEKFGIVESVLPGTDIKAYLVSKGEYFARPGLYCQKDGEEFEDNAARFSFFCRAAVTFIENLEVPPDIVHCHDWQTGLIPAYLRNYIKPATVFTIHNMHFQGNYSPEQYECTYLPWSLYRVKGLEFFGTFSFLKSGIVYSDQITTVSRTYAEEILTPEFGEGFDGLLRMRSKNLTGILNGIDYDSWNPETDDTIASPYSADSISGRRSCRRSLLRALDLDRSTGRVTVGIVSRLTAQKGLDILFPMVSRLIASGINFAVLGTGERHLMDRLSKLSLEHPSSISVSLRYDEEMARLIFAGSDIVMMPSRFEPCGLAQMIGMRYGAVPLVSRTGGLADTVIDEKDGGFGFVMNRTGPEDLYSCITRAMELFRRRNRWAWIIKKCMRQDNSWRSRVSHYNDVYSRAVETRKGR
jgi:starch synthase